MRKKSAVLGLALVGLILTSNEICAQWELTNAPEGDWIYVYAFVTGGSRVFAGADTSALADFGGSVFVSTDNGANWTNSSAGLTAPEVLALAVKDTNIYAGTRGAGVFLSTDNASTWKHASLGLTDTIVTALAVSGGKIFAGTNGGGVYLSTDNAATWSAIGTGLPEAGVSSLAINGAGIFAATSDGVYLSADSGATWMAVNNGLPNTLWGARLAVSGTNIFVGAQGGVFFSADSGANWTDVSSGLPNLWVFDLVASGSNVFVLTNWGGVSVSTDNGASWTLVNEGLIDTLVLAIGLSDTFAYLGGASGSMWRRPLSQMVPSVISVEELAASLPLSFNLHQNYPNPFNPVTTLRFDLPQAAAVQLIVYDLQGREVARLLDGAWPAGYHYIVWDGRNAGGQETPSGIYIGRMATPEYTQSIKMVLLK